MIDTVLCDCRCPDFGNPDSEVYEVKCDCGKRAFVCGRCLVDGRRKDCGCGIAQSSITLADVIKEEF